MLSVKDTFMPAEQKMDSRLVFAQRKALGQDIGTAAKNLVKATATDTVEVEIATATKAWLEKGRGLWRAARALPAGTATDRPEVGPYLLTEQRRTARRSVPTCSRDSDGPPGGRSLPARGTATDRPEVGPYLPTHFLRTGS